MFFNVSGTFDTLKEPVLKIYEAKFEIWKCTWKGSAPCSYLSPALPFPVSRTRNHFTEGTFVKLEWTLPHFLLVFCRSLHCIIHIGNIHPERRIITFVCLLWRCQHRGHTMAGRPEAPGLLSLTSLGRHVSRRAVRSSWHGTLWHCDNVTRGTLRTLRTLTTMGTL